MSDNSYDFEDILNEALKGKSESKASDGPRLHGTFRMLATYGKSGTTAKGFPQVSVVWQVQGGPDNGAEKWQNVVISPKSKGRAGKTILSFGFTSDYLLKFAGADNFGQALDAVAEDVVGVLVDMKIQPQSTNKDFDEFEVLAVIAGPNVSTASVPSGLPTVPSFTNGPQTQVTYPSPHTNPAVQGGQVGVPAGAIPGGGFIPQV